MIGQVNMFKTTGDGILYCEPYGNGHINRTYLVVDTSAREYILQKINKTVFKDPESLMKNITAVTGHLRKTAETSRQVLSLVPTKDGRDWLVDSGGEFWRMYRFISDSMCFEKAATPAIFRESAAAFGNFQRQLSDFPAHTLIETIPDFHNTPVRFKDFCKAVEADVCDRAKEVAREIGFVLEREAYVTTLTELQACGDLPLRVTHNDTKLNNVLFDCDTGKGLCVIDLDTVMPGLSVNDFGDSIRFGSSSAAEDEPDLSKVYFVPELFEAYSDGFLSSCGKSLTECEILHLRDGAKMMTLECGMRFLADYLSGDIYFKIHREGHNLDRARTQFKLISGMEECWDEMQNIITLNR